jgi:PAS domain S-box-containing protein
MSSAVAVEEARHETLSRLAVLDTPAEAVFDGLTALAARLCDAPIALLSFVDGQRQWFKSRFGYELAEIPREVSFCNWTLEGTGLFVVEDAAKDDRFCANPFVTGEPNLRFYAGAPIRLETGPSLGTLCVVDRKARPLTVEQRLALENLAALAAAQLASRLPATERQLLRETMRLNEELTALASVTDGALSTLKIDPLLRVLLDRLLDVMHADAGAVLLCEDDRLVVRATRGFSRAATELPSVPLGEGIGGRIATTREALSVSDVRTDARVHGTFLADEGIVSMLGVPLLSGERLVGVLHVDWRRPREASESDVGLLRTAAERCAAAIENARLFSELSAVQEETARAKDRLALAVGAARLGVWDWDIALGTVVWDEENERIFGLPPGTYDGTLEAWWRAVHPDDRALVEERVGATLAGAPYEVSFRIVCPDGEMRWLAVRGHVQRGPNGAPLRLLGVTMDVTAERRRAEERERLLDSEKAARREAERAERQIVNILERVSDAFVALDADWRYTYVSRKAGEIFGREPAQLVGKHIWTEFPEGVGQPFHEAYERAAREQTVVRFEDYYPPYDRWFENRVYPGPDGLSIFFSDITEKKRTDERLRATNEQLRALSARLQTVREEEAVRIAREIHDELGQLLTALRLDVGWLRSRLAKATSEDTAPLRARADAMSELAERTIRTVQRISEELRPSALDQLGLEAALASHLEDLESRSGIATSFVSRIQDRRLPPPVETAVFRIVQELLTNVARHSGARSARVALSEEGGTVQVEVADDGRGIREEELLDPRSLGLVGIRERALLLGGAVDVRGTPGGGTRAVVRIPVETSA